MEVFLENIKSNPELYLKPYLKKYRNKRIWKELHNGINKQYS
jgi:hypothetical protein